MSTASARCNTHEKWSPWGRVHLGSPAHAKLENYLRQHLKNDDLEEDAFIADTPKGKFPARNFIAKFPGTKDGIIVIAGHYETEDAQGLRRRE